jgi:hypothetical protein
MFSRFHNNSDKSWASAVGWDRRSRFLRGAVDDHFEEALLFDDTGRLRCLDGLRQRPFQPNLPIRLRYMVLLLPVLGNGYYVGC